MSTVLPLLIEAQPDLESCGPTCLHAVYRYYGDLIPLPKLIEDIGTLEEGGTLEVQLGCHALKRGYRVTIYTFNLTLFDPTWFGSSTAAVVEKLQQQAACKPDPKLRVATDAYTAYLRLGGGLRMADLTVALLRRYLRRGVPLLTGLSATYLYQTCRERVTDSADDDIRGVPTGHFVVLCGYDKTTRQVHIADPYCANPLSAHPQYNVPIERVQCAILLGIITYDASLMIIEPPRRPAAKQGA